MAHPQPPRPTTFFDLPTGARKKIYRAALVRRCLIDLGPVQPAEENRGSPRDCHYLMRTVKGFSIGHGRHRDCYCPMLDTQLLRVSRAIHNEAKPKKNNKNKNNNHTTTHTQNNQNPQQTKPTKKHTKKTTQQQQLNTW